MSAPRPRKKIPVRHSSPRPRPGGVISAVPLSHKPRGRRDLVVLGTGFGAFTLIRSLNDSYAVTVISPRNHFLFTPLLPSTTVGTVEFRSIIEPIRRVRREIRFFHAHADTLDLGGRTVSCAGVTAEEKFSVPYDILVIAVGAVSNTFNVPGAAGHAHFLKELQDARVIRQRVIQTFEHANLPVVSQDERRHLLHFVICGGGPTGVEFAAELHDFLVEDLQRTYPDLVPLAQITIVEASRELLNTFDAKLRRYAEDLFRRQRIQILSGSPVVRVTDDSVVLASGVSIPYGLLLWSTGNGPGPFVRCVPLPKSKRGHLLVDGYFRVRGHDSIYAIGDCAALEDSPLPETAQVAQQEGRYLARALNRLARGAAPEPFLYHHLGMLAYIGGNKALADLQNFKGRGRATWLFWRSAYLTRIVSLKNKVLVLFDWIKAQIFGRDISQF